ncbi:hypothetical protein AAEX28_13975 [Lentisphaerota bacterium WC36G]|nr:hypothetical protein LJT99_00725 [Lentisphaerae bacterium WC36]
MWQFKKNFLCFNALLTLTITAFAENTPSPNQDACDHLLIWGNQSCIVSDGNVTLRYLLGQAISDPTPYTKAGTSRVLTRHPCPVCNEKYEEGVSHYLSILEGYPKVTGPNGCTDYSKIGTYFKTYKYKCEYPSEFVNDSYPGESISNPASKASCNPSDAVFTIIIAPPLSCSFNGDSVISKYFTTPDGISHYGIGVNQIEAEGGFPAYTYYIKTTDEPYTTWTPTQTVTIQATSNTGPSINILGKVIDDEENEAQCSKKIQTRYPLLASEPLPNTKYLIKTGKMEMDITENEASKSASSTEAYTVGKSKSLTLGGSPLTVSLSENQSLTTQQAKSAVYTYNPEFDTYGKGYTIHLNISQYANKVLETVWAYTGEDTKELVYLVEVDNKLAPDVLFSHTEPIK